MKTATSLSAKREFQIIIPSLSQIIFSGRNESENDNKIIKNEIEEDPFLLYMYLNFLLFLACLD